MRKDLKEAGRLGSEAFAHLGEEHPGSRIAGAKTLR